MSDIRHLEMEQLLALRDGEGTEFASSHVEVCSDCRRELDRLHQVRAELRALHPLAPPRDLWPRVAAQLARRRLERRLISGGAIGLAAAAALTGFLVVRSPAVDEGPVIVGTAVPDVWVAETGSEDLGPMIVRSRQLEMILRDFTSESQVLDAPTALAVSVLEDRIQLIDAALIEGRSHDVDRELLRDLWTDRVNSLETLLGLQLVDQDGVWR